MPERSAPRQQKDAMGFALCRMPQCGKRVGKGLRSYCSRECREAFAIAYFNSSTRWHVFKRDKGVCARCGVDTERLARIFRIASKMLTNSDWLSTPELRASWRALGFHGHWRQGGDRWQADHIQECVRGGWGKGLDNFRTLCTPCHKAETARLARELAESRPLKGSLFDENADQMLMSIREGACPRKERT